MVNSSISGFGLISPFSCCSKQEEAPGQLKDQIGSALESFEIVHRVKTGEDRWDVQFCCLKMLQPYGADLKKMIALV